MLPRPRFAALVVLLGLFPVSLTAEALTEREARREVASPRGAEVRVADLPFLSGDMRRRVERAAKEFPYYAALVLSPGDPQANQSGLTVANYHSPDAATRAALDACNRRRTTGAECVVVAQVLPRGYERGDLTLSKEATDALRGDFRRLDPPKALAISPATGQFGFARGDGARALSGCNRKAAERGVEDCRIVVSEP